MCILRLEHLAALPGRPDAAFHAVVNFALTEFSEVPRRPYTHGVFPPHLEAFDDDELRVGGLAAQLPEGSVFRGVVPLVEALRALEFENDQALGVPVPLQYLNCATASEVFATIAGDGGRRLLPVFGIVIRIGDSDVYNCIDCHRLSSFTPLPSLSLTLLLGHASRLCSYPYPPECVERLSEKPRIGPRGGPARGQKGPLGPFDRPYTAQIHARSVAPNPFSDGFSRYLEAARIGG